MKQKAYDENRIDWYKKGIEETESEKLLEIEHGAAAIGLLVKIERLIFKDNGYFVELDNKFYKIVAAFCQLDTEQADNIIKSAVEYGVFDAQAYNKYNVLTNTEIQLNYFRKSEKAIRNKRGYQEKKAKEGGQEPAELYALEVYREIWLLDETITGKLVALKPYPAAKNVDEMDGEFSELLRMFKNNSELLRIFKNNLEFFSNSKNVLEFFRPLEKNRIEKNRIEKNRIYIGSAEEKKAGQNMTEEKTTAADQENKNLDKVEPIEQKNPPKKEKPVRHKHGFYKNVLLSDTDLEKLQTEFPNDWAERIEKLSEYIASTGKSYKNHLATIRNWARRDGGTQQTHTQTKAQPSKYGQTF